MCGRGRWVATALLAIAIAGGPASAEAQGVGRPATLLLLPLDVGQGAVIDAEGVTPYMASMKLQLALGLGRGGPLRIGPVAAVRYANPDWTAGAGIRGQWFPLRFGLGDRRWGVALAAEQLWDTGAHRPVSFGVIGDLELVRLGGWLVRNRGDETTGFEFSLGTDLRSLWAVLFPAEDPDPFPGIP